MARYIDADKLIEELKLLEMFITGMLCGKTLITEAVAEYKKSALRLIDEQPTADVAPKSEVDRLEAEVRLLTENSILAKYPCRVSCSKGLIFTKSLEEYDKLLADIASEVAREIIEDIEMYVLGIKSGKEIIEKTTPRIYRLKRKDYMEAVLEYLAELKKKYTEEKE